MIIGCFCVSFPVFFFFYLFCVLKWDEQINAPQRMWLADWKYCPENAGFLFNLSYTPLWQWKPEARNVVSLLNLRRLLWRRKSTSCKLADASHLNGGVCIRFGGRVGKRKEDKQKKTRSGGPIQTSAQIAGIYSMWPLDWSHAFITSYGVFSRCVF